MPFFALHGLVYRPQRATQSHDGDWAEFSACENRTVSRDSLLLGPNRFEECSSIGLHHFLHHDYRC
jgi:hypothetical protein